MKLMKLKMKYRKRFFPQFFRQSLKFDISLKKINIFFIDNKKLLVSITVCSCAVKFTRNLEVNACERVDEILKKSLNCLLNTWLSDQPLGSIVWGL